MVQMAFPMLPIFFNPCRDFTEGFQFCAAITFPTLLFYPDEAAFCENFYMLGDGRPARVEVFGDPVQVQRLCSQQVDDLPSCGICNGLKYISAFIHL